MPINIHISGDHAQEALRELKDLSTGLLGNAAPAAPAAPPPPPAPEPEKPAEASKKGGRKTKKTEPAPKEPEMVDVPDPDDEGQTAVAEPEAKSVEAPSDAPDLDTNDVRGCIALVNACKDMTAARGLLSKFDAKKVSDIDKKHYGELVEQTAELLGVEYGPALRGAKVTMLLTKLADDDDGKALKEKFGGEGALTISDAEFDALEKAAG